MCSRSIASSFAGASALRAIGSALRGRGACACSSGPKAPASSRSDTSVPSVSMHARSITFFSSRIFPSHRAFRSTRSACGVRPVTGLRIRCAQSRRNADVRYGMLHDVQAIEKIAAEAPSGDFGAQIAVGRRDDGDVDSLRLQGADALHFAVFERAQQLGLHRQGQLADFVEEQRAALCGLEHSRLRLDRAGERAAHVAEQLALEQRVHDRRAVDRHKRPRLA